VAATALAALEYPNVAWLGAPLVSVWGLASTAPAELLAVLGVLRGVPR
jgi:hypothetical protein